MNPERLFLAMFGTLLIAKKTLSAFDLSSAPLRTIFNKVSSGLSEPIVKNGISPILISIEGNIGAGKTTLLKKLRANRPDWTFINEPVDSWTKIKNENDQNILEVFYKDRKRWSYTFQNCALLTRYQEIENTINSVYSSGASTHAIFLTERCLDTDYHVFTKMLAAEGSLNSIELHLYERLLNQLKSTATPLSAIVHVNTPPEICLERIRTRDRSGEQAISLDYLRALNRYQCDWIENTSVKIHTTDLTNVQNVEDFISSLIVNADSNRRVENDTEKEMLMKRFKESE